MTDIELMHKEQEKLYICQKRPSTVTPLKGTSSKYLLGELSTNGCPTFQIFSSKTKMKILMISLQPYDNAQLYDGDSHAIPKN